MDNTITLNLHFTIDKNDADKLIDAINSVDIFKQCLDEKGVFDLKLIKYLKFIPDKYITKDKLYWILRKRGIKINRAYLDSRLYYLNIYGFIDMFEDSGEYFIKNITKDIINLNIKKVIK